MEDGTKLNLLIDTGSNQNYIQPNLVPHPKKNEGKFFANSVGGQTPITHHTFLTLFNNRDRPIKFFLLPTLKTFHGILGNDTLKQLNAVINVKNDILTLNGNYNIRVKQLVTQSVNNIKLRMEHMSNSQKNLINSLTQKHSNLFADPDERLTYTTRVIVEIRTSSDAPVTNTTRTQLL